MKTGGSREEGGEAWEQHSYAHHALMAITPLHHAPFNPAQQNTLNSCTMYEPKNATWHTICSAIVVVVFASTMTLYRP